MSISMIQILPEPLIEFRFGQCVEDPHDGLTLFGPWDTDKAEKPRRISCAIVGPPEGIAQFREFIQRLQLGAQVGAPQIDESMAEQDRKKAIEKYERRLRLWPTFPGFENAFLAELTEVPAKVTAIDRNALLEMARQKNKYARAYGVVNAYLDAIRGLTTPKRDEKLDMVFCVVPDEVWKNCRQESSVANATGEPFDRGELKDAQKGQQRMFGSVDLEQYRLCPDFRRQLKARSMKYGLPIQIILESTLATDETDSQQRRGMTPLSDRAWNLLTTAYYKAGGKPWRLSGVREGVCYIGMTFKQTGKSSDDRSACCAAQMFLDSGDGVVFRGTDGRWWSPEKKQFHLDRDASRALLKGVLDTYTSLDGGPLSEIFIHCRSGLDAEEIAGFEQACPEGAKLVVVRIRRERRDMRLYRQGSYPVLRGTFVRKSARFGFLWTSGFKPRLDSYDGWEIPCPLEISVQHGDVDISQVAQDVFGLTKLNYNACKLGDAEPVTIGFSDMVGEILVSNPDVKDPDPRFKFYI